MAIETASNPSAKQAIGEKPVESIPDRAFDDLLRDTPTEADIRPYAAHIAKAYAERTDLTPDHQYTIVKATPYGEFVDVDFLTSERAAVDTARKLQLGQFWRSDPSEAYTFAAFNIYGEPIVNER